MAQKKQSNAEEERDQGLQPGVRGDLDEMIIAMNAPPQSEYPIIQDTESMPVSRAMEVKYLPSILITCNQHLQPLEVWLMAPKIALDNDSISRLVV